MQRAQLGPGLDADLLDERRRAPGGTRRARPPGGRSGTAPASAARAGARAAGARRRAPRARRPAARAGRARARRRSRSSTATRRSSSSRSTSTRANGSNSRSASGRPRHSPSASRSASPRPPGPRARAPAAPRRAAFEAVQVEPAGRDVQHVARRARDEHRVAAAVRAERLAEPRDVDLERVAGGGGRVVGPQLLDQPIAGHDAVGLQQQDREQRPLLGAAEREPVTVRADLERAEDAEVDGSPGRPATLSRSGRGAPATESDL